MILLDGGIGLLGAGVAFFWANFHWRLMDFFRVLGLLDDENRYAVTRILLGHVVLSLLVCWCRKQCSGTSGKWEPLPLYRLPPSYLTYGPLRGLLDLKWIRAEIVSL